MKTRESNEKPVSEKDEQAPVEESAWKRERKRKHLSSMILEDLVAEPVNLQRNSSLVYFRTDENSRLQQGYFDGITYCVVE